MPVRLLKLLVVGLACQIALACGGPAPAPPATSGAPDAAAVALNNRGVALMGYFDYAAARDTFADLVASNPGWVDARINLAVATLNRQEAGDEQVALEILTAVLTEQPDELRAHYMSGIINLYIGETDKAREHFTRVATDAPDDAYAAYYLGQILLQLGDFEQAVERFNAAIELDPYLRSSYYGALLALRRLGREDEAQAMLDAHQRFENNPRATLAEFKYTRMGPLASARASASREAPEHPAPDGAIFGATQPVVAASPLAGDGLVTTADIDGDGLQDLYVNSPAAGVSAVFLGRPDGGFEHRPDHPLSGIDKVAAVAWGDVDNDGRNDAYLCRRGRAQLWMHSDDGWVERGVASGTAGRILACNDAAFFDADHDGDLDLFAVYEDARAELFNNDLAGSFRPIAAAQGIAGRPGGRQVLAADLDGDRDVDIAVIHASPPHAVWSNDRLWSYRADDSFANLRAVSLRAAVVGDADADGRPEMYALHDGGQIWRWGAGDDGRWAAGDLVAESIDPRAQLALQDFTGNGAPELLVTGPAGGTLIKLASRADRSPQRLLELDTAGVALPVLVNAGAGPSLAILAHPAGSTATSALSILPPGPGRFPFVALQFAGRENRAEAMRSNASGIGTYIAMRSGSEWSIVSNFDGHSGPGQSLQPLSLGIAGRPRADYVAIDWSDGVFQTELDLEPGTLRRITETQRQLSSCPVLFVWDGTRYRFVSDLLGVAGLGFFASPGVYSTPRPREAFRLPDGLLQESEGFYRMKIGEPMEEIAYIDALALRAYEIPADWALVLDERMGVNGAVPSGEPFFYRRSVAPVRVTNERGEDVTAALAERDLDAAPPGPLDRRFLGRLAGMHSLTLDFGAALDELPGRPVLVADGWVEYPYSQTVFAAWQAGARYIAPSLEAAGADGVWHPVAMEFGYPAGMPREMALPLTGLPRGTRRLRLHGNLEIYWDRLRVVAAEPLSAVFMTRIAPSQARLANTGFPLRSNGAQAQPDYDYAQRSPFWDTRYPSGFYTTVGPVGELVATRDDAFAIVGPGEELHLEFAADLPPVRAGMRRVFVLDAYGYAKDMDLYTRDGGTVGPLPASSDDPAWIARRDALHARYQLRYQAGR